MLWPKSSSRRVVLTSRSFWRLELQCEFMSQACMLRVCRHVLEEAASITAHALALPTGMPSSTSFRTCIAVLQENA